MVMALCQFVTSVRVSVPPEMVVVPLCRIFPPLSVWLPEPCLTRISLLASAAPVETSRIYPL